MRKYGMCFGLTKVNPDCYDGWDGACPGADVDVLTMCRRLHRENFDGIYAGLNASVDHSLVKPVFLEVCRRLEPGDLLVLLYSGHGGWQPDKDGDEDDGRDETLVWWSGELLDDSIGEYLRMIPAGVSVVFFTDSCHSGTVSRGVVTRPNAYRWKRTLRRGRYRLPKPSSPIAIPKAAGDLKCSLLHVAGCSDSRYSYGDKDGGELTQNWERVQIASRKPLTYRKCFDRVLVRMPSYQTPVMTNYGPADISDRVMWT